MCVSQDGSELRDGVLAKLAALTVLLRLPNLGLAASAQTPTTLLV